MIILLINLPLISLAAETEPNNTAAQANILALNGSNSGALKPVGDIDWWKLTTNANGKLDVSIKSSSGKYVAVTIYDFDGTTSLKTASSNSNFVVTYDGAAAGTFYVKVTSYYANDTATYAIANTLTVPAQANDIEPNNSASVAQTLLQNTSVTGHIGYYNKLQRDSSDWYKLNLSADGLLKLKLTPVNSQFVYVYLYDANGSTLLGSASGASTFYG